MLEVISIETFSVLIDAERTLLSTKLVTTRNEAANAIATSFVSLVSAPFLE